MVHAFRALYRFLVYGNEFLLQQCASTCRDTRVRFRRRRLLCLLPLYPVHRRVVFPTERHGLRYRMERRGVRRCRTPSAPPDPPQQSRVPDSYQSLGWDSLCVLDAVGLLHQTQTAVLGNDSYAPVSMRYIMSRLFGLYQVANFIQATGYFLPGIYPPTYARTAFGASNLLSTLTVILTNISATMGCVVMGVMTDKFHATTCMIISAIGTAISVLVVWGLSSSLPVLYVFCL